MLMILHHAFHFSLTHIIISSKRLRNIVQLAESGPVGSKKNTAPKKNVPYYCAFILKRRELTLTTQEPENNIIRVTLQALAAVLGGSQSIHTNSFDEALALPTEKAVKMALRTQQIIAHESGVADTIDPLAGSYYLEWLTNKMEEEAEKYFERIEAMGGVIPAIKDNFFQKEIAQNAYRSQQEIDDKTRIIVGVNEFITAQPAKIEILKIRDDYQQKQIQKLDALKQTRDNDAVEHCLQKIERLPKVLRI